MAIHEGQTSFQRYSKPVADRMTPEAVRVFDESLKSYWIKKTLTFPTPIESEMVDFDRYLFDDGAISKDGGVIITGYKPSVWSDSNPARLLEPVDCYPILYEQLMEDFQQWKRWKARKEYAIKMQSTPS